MSSGTSASNRRPTTIGFRITLLGAGITVAGCLLLSAILYFGLSWSLDREVDGFLDGEIAEVAALLREHAHDYRAAEEALRAELGYRASPDLVLRLLDEDGDVLVSSDEEREEWSVDLPTRTASGTGTDTLFETIRLPGREYPVRLCSKLFEAQDGKTYIAQAGYVLDSVSTSLAAFRKVCLAALVLVALGSVWGGRILARGILGPIQAMTTTAQRISARELADRLPRTKTHDELDQLAATLNEMLDRIQHHVMQLRQFTADASHEFRSPLAALRGTAEVALTRERSADELRGVIERFTEQFDRLTRVAEDLLLLARAEAGQLPLQQEPTRLDLAVADVLDLYEPTAAEQGISLVAELCEPIWVCGDAGRLRQMIGNLVDNAIKYGGAGGEVRVSAVTADGLARLTVEDKGDGISPQDLPRVFDRFYRTDRSRSVRRSRGAGLGLPICRMIAEAHGGRIELESSCGQGTCATVTLPPIAAPAALGETNRGHLSSRTDSKACP